MIPEYKRTLSLLTHFLGYRKESLEKELNEIEADIKKLASRGPVYITE